MEVVKIVNGLKIDISYELTQSEFDILYFIYQKGIFSSVSFPLENNQEQLDRTRKHKKHDAEVLTENGFLQLSEGMYDDHFDLTALGEFYIKEYASQLEEKQD